MLQGGREVVCVTVRDEVDIRLSQYVWQRGVELPEVEVLGHVHLLEDVHQPLFFCWFVDFLVESDRKHFCSFTMVKVVAS